MTSTLKQAIDEAQYVRVFGPESAPLVAVWHGGHTINYYAVSPDGGFEATTAQSVGDYETGETTLEEVKEAIERQIEDAGY